MAIKVIDGHCSPPIEGTLQLRAYTSGISQDRRTRRGYPTDQAFESRSLDVFLQQQRSLGVVRSVFIGKAKGPGAVATAQHEQIENATVARMCKEHPGMFVGVASIDGLGSKNGADEASQALDNGFVGIHLGPGWTPERGYVSDKRLFPIYETCLAKDRPVFLTCGGTAGPDISYSNPLHIDLVAHAFPNLKILVPYAGWPFVTEMMGVVYRRTNVWVMPDSYYPAGMPGEEDYTRSLNTFARERFVYSTNYPHNAPQQHLENALALKISPLALERYLYWNAVELLKLNLDL